MLEVFVDDWQQASELRRKRLLQLWVIPTSRLIVWDRLKRKRKSNCVCSNSSSVEQTHPWLPLTLGIGFQWASTHWVFTQCCILDSSCSWASIFLEWAATGLFTVQYIVGLPQLSSCIIRHICSIDSSPLGNPNTLYKYILSYFFLFWHFTISLNSLLTYTLSSKKSADHIIFILV